VEHQREDYADRELPPARRPSRMGVALAVFVAVVLILIALPLLAQLVAARMVWN
jgi:hypothetical protein